jgi:hypothetical protein
LFVMKKAKPTHPADVINLADIATAKEFTATLFLGSGQFGKAKADNLAAIRAKAVELQKANPNTSAKPIIHAIVNGKALPVPAKYAPPANVIGNAFAGPAPAIDSERKKKREATVAAVKAAAIEPDSQLGKPAPKPTAIGERIGMTMHQLPIRAVLAIHSDAPAH